MLVALECVDVYFGQTWVLLFNFLDQSLPLILGQGEADAGNRYTIPIFLQISFYVRLALRFLRKLVKVEFLEFLMQHYCFFAVDEPVLVAVKAANLIVLRSQLCIHFNHFKRDFFRHLGLGL